MRRCLAVLILLALLAVGCSDDTGSGGSTTSEPDATTTTLDPLVAARAYTEPGPHPVGVTTLQLESGPKVEVWYPAVEGTTGTVTYDVRDYVPEGVRALLTGDVPVTSSIDGARDADVADGTFPVVLSSHGVAGFRVISSFLTAHLASVRHGGAGARPPQPGSHEQPPGQHHARTRRPRSTSCLGALDLILAANETAGDRFEGHVDADHVATMGHSAGGGTALAAARDPRIDGYLSMASGGPEDSADYPDVPSFFLAGAEDGLVSAAERTQPAYEAAPAPSRFWEIAGAGHHTGFDDLCTLGGGTGIIGIAEASGLGPLLDAQPEFRRLGEDGCLPPAVKPAAVFPVVLPRQHGVAPLALRGGPRARRARPAAGGRLRRRGHGPRQVTG